VNVNHTLKGYKIITEFLDDKSPGHCVNSKGRIDVKL